MNKELRWQQRFQNFERAFLLLDKSIDISDPSDTERAGIIQFFEMSFELSWNLMKDYLESEGFVVDTPRESLKQAFQSNVITDGHVWMEALDDRNLTAHTYDEATAEKVIGNIKEKYHPALSELYKSFKARIEG